MPNSLDEAQSQLLARSILANCAIKHGGVAALSKHLGVEEQTLLFWIGGKSAPPVEIVRKAVEPFITDA